ncbi:zinc transporter ZIP11-like [Tiliqua scincoides]|uniref:zinc transporter ZIP11-like n=1 Tax=Tiliqua scincoides TaxID=71010 RepID=UPI00346264BA
MLLGYSPVSQALLGTLLTWGLTAAGSALVFVFSSGQRRVLDGSLGFAAGVMLAASYWSLLAPAIELAEESGKFGAFAFFPVMVGFTLGAAFVYFADLLLPWLGISDHSPTSLALSYDSRVVKEKYESQPMHRLEHENELSIRIGRTVLHSASTPVAVDCQRQVTNIGSSEALLCEELIRVVVYFCAAFIKTTLCDVSKSEGNQRVDFDFSAAS